MANFKKIGVAAAVAATLGATGVAQALTLGEPGDALLIPHVYASSDATTNTLIGVIVAPNSAVFRDQLPDGTWEPFPTLTDQPDDAADPLANGEDACSYLSGPGGTGNVLTLPRLHWYFFDARSNKVADDSVPVSCHDFVRIDWAYLAAQKGQLGVRGYMVITDQRNYVSNGIPDTNTMIMYGASFMIQGNWQSQAFIPVLPIRNDPDGAGDVQATAPDELFFGGQNFPAEVNPVSAGMALPADGVVPPQTATFSLRYFQDPALSGGTAFVIWFPDNGAAKTTDSNGVSTYSCPSGTTPGKPGGRCRLGLTLDYYDADENQASTAYRLPDEVNIINPVTDLHISATHVAANPIPDLGDPANGAAIGTGFAIFSLSDGVPTASLPDGYATRLRGGVAFSLIDINGANGAQVQTELAHERGIRAPGG